ncbi:S-adenosyl-L-methionine-dependent methyltransferase [Clavulina sp. PMI_390]|nr:S-adenosyl-L-methionine-dependent methyltransferase [Clavulina sp. PMI_390]
MASLGQLSDRPYHSDPNSRYALPNDEREGRRLQMQHDVIGTSQGGLYPASIDGRIRKATRILDIGCGPGLWAAKMAELLPNAEVIGVDISPTRPQSWHPKNLSFVIGNIHNGLSFEDGYFDVVNIRSTPDISFHQKSYYEVARLLKSGGIFNSVVVNDLWSPDKSFSPSVKRAFVKLKEGLDARDSKLFGDHVPSLMRETGAFRNISVEERDVPVGPWMEGEDMKALGDLELRNLLEGITAYRPIYLSLGFTPDECDQLVEKIKEESLDGSFHVFWRYQLIYATKL